MRQNMYKRNTKASMVYLVGAGPGDPSLLTLKAVELLEGCDVLLYDRLVTPQILRYARHAILIPVGKRPASPQKSSEIQNSIHDKMIAYSYMGLKVVRLKGGDPCIFGRGGEEALALAKAGVPFAFVPGVSSFYAAPEAFGISLTHRAMSSGFAVFTAHEALCPEDSGGKAGMDWQSIVTIPTLIFLMGRRKLPSIVQKLLRHGCSPKKPIALFMRATYPNQEMIIDRLGNILKRLECYDQAAANKAVFSQCTSPLTIVVGDVLKLRFEIEAAKQLFLGQVLEYEENSDEELDFILRGEAYEAYEAYLGA